MARTPYSDPEAEKVYQDIEAGSSKPMGTELITDMDLTSQRNADQIQARPRRRGRPAIGNGNED